MGKAELGTRFVFGPLMLLLVGGVYYADTQWTEGRLSAGVLGLLGFVGVLEFIAMFKKADLPIAPRWLGFVTPVLLALPFFFAWKNVDRELYPLVVGTMMLLFPVALQALTEKGSTRGMEAMGGTMLGFLLIAWPMYMAQGVALRHLPSVLFVVLVCKGGDIGGYLAGVSFGKRKLIPHISPGKTIEGSLGSMVASCGVAAALRGLLLAPEVPVELTGSILIGIMLNVTTQIGDLVESLLKRRCGVKDSSHMLPAHGGVLDLIDSLMFSFPAYLLVLTLLTGDPS